MENYMVKVKDIVIQEEMYYKHELLLSYEIHFPQFISNKFQNNLDKINMYYKKGAFKYQQYCVHRLFKMAIEQYEDAVKNNFPVRAFEIFIDYTITYNLNCTLSLYFDQYEYTGGAHGMTVRTSNNWDIKNCRPITLQEMFIPVFDYKTYIIETIYEQIEQQKNYEDVLFEDYEKLIVDTFNKDSFYLTNKGIVIYFQHYDIAPYSSGIVEFLIPYKDKLALKPICM